LLVGENSIKTMNNFSEKKKVFCYLYEYLIILSIRLLFFNKFPIARQTSDENLQLIRIREKQNKTKY